MNCPKCQTQNEESAQFCRNCGTHLRLTKEPITSNKTTDLLILSFLICMVVSSFAKFASRELVNLAGFVSQKFIDNWFEEIINIPIGMNIILGFATILLGIAIKNKERRILGIIFASISAIYIIYSNLIWVLR